MRRAVLLLFLPLLLLVPPRAGAEDETPIVRVPFVEPVPDQVDYYGVYEGRRKLGWGVLSILRERPGDGDPLYVSRSVFRADTGGLGLRDDLDFESVDVFQGTPPYPLLHAWERRDDGPAVARVEVLRDGGDYRFLTVGALGAQASRVSLDYTLVDRLTQVEWVRRRPAVGARIATSELDISRGRPRVFVYEVLERKGLRAGAVTVEGTRLSLGARDLGGLGEGWFDRWGRPLVAPLGPDLEMRLESETQAKDRMLASDLFRFGRAPVVDPIGDTRSIVRLAIAAFGRGAKDFPPDRRVTVTWQEDLLEADVVSTPASPEGTPATDEETRTARAAAALPAALRAPVARLAARAVGDAPSDGERLQRLLGFTRAWIADAFAPEEPSLAALLDEPAGDATEHVRAFVALADAAGLVARPVAGLVYVGDEGKAFEPHAWCDVLLDGRWVEVDPTLGLARVTAAHLPFARGSDDVDAVAKRSRHLQFEVREVLR
jgi:hypothetical protein